MMACFTVARSAFSFRGAVGSNGSEGAKEKKGSKAAKPKPKVKGEDEAEETGNPVKSRPGKGNGKRY